MNNDSMMIYEAYGTVYRGPKTEQDSKDYSMNIAPYMHIIKKLSQGAFDTDSEQDLVSKGELQGIFEMDVVDGHRQVVLTNDAVKKIEQMHPELKGKFWECGKCKADYAGCGEAKHDHEEEEGDLMKHMKDKGMIDPKATDDTGKYGRTREEEEHCTSEDEQRRLDPKCWKGYHKSGTKLKDGVRVNNCVKNS
jgi:hypothetical protein